MDILRFYSYLLVVIGTIYVGMFLYSLTKRDTLSS